MFCGDTQEPQSEVFLGSAERLLINEVEARGVEPLSS